MDQNNPGSGSFMSGMPGAGPELQQLMQQRQGGVLNQNTQSPSAVMPSSPPPMGSAIPQGIVQRPQPAPQPQPGMQQGAGGQMPVTNGNPELQIALNALSQYVKSHGNVLEAQHNVPLKKAHASVVASQAQSPQGGQG